jgi:subtilisin family serine protease
MTSRRFPSLFVAPALALVLVACGGGGGGGAATPTPEPVVRRARLVVKPTSEAALESFVQPIGGEVLGEVPGTGWCTVVGPAGKDGKVFLGEVQGAECVEEAVEDEEIGFPEGGGGTIPLFGDDPFQAIADQDALRRIGADVANGRGLRGEGAIVAVIDTGVAADHPAIAGRIAPGGYDFVDGDADPADVSNGLDDNGDGRIDEGTGHGTFVASLILAVAPDARILPIRALDSDAFGTASSVAHAITHAVEHGATVINLSAGLQTHLAMIQAAVEIATEAGVLVIASAGNRAMPVIDFPAAIPDVVAVASVDLTDTVAPFTSYSQKVDFSAPGVEVIGAHPRSPSGTARWSGTSFSTALVTAAYALVKADMPEESPQGLIECLKDASAGLDDQNPKFKGVLGEGRIDLDAATATH